MITKHPRLTYGTHTLDEYLRIYSEPASAENTKRVDETIIEKDGGNPDWYGGFSATAQATKLLTDGWQAGADRLSDLRREIDIPGARTRKRTICWSDSGDELSIDRAMRGQFDSAWRSTRRAWSAGNATIDIVALIGGRHLVTADQLFWSGAAAVVAVDVLESAGYSVKLIGASIVECVASAGWCGNFVTIKDTHEPLRVDVVAGFMCHAGTFRTHMLRARVTLPHNIGDGFGATRGFDAGDAMDRVHESGAVAEDSIKLTQAYDRETCIERIRGVIARVQE